MAKTVHFRLIKDGTIGSKSKGIWLRNSIMLTNLPIYDKIILCIVQGFQAGGSDCFVSDDYLAEVCSCKRESINRHVNRLVKAKTLHKRFKRVNGQMKRILWVA